MTFTLSLSLGWLVVTLLSLCGFLAVTWLCHAQGMFDGGGSGGFLAGLDSLFTFVFYVIFWAIPSLLAIIIKLAFF